MKIAVNTRFLLANGLEGIGWFTYEIVRRMVANHPEHDFIFFFDRPYDNRFLFEKNITPVILQPPARHPLLWKIWYDFSIKKALKKYKADLFISTDGFCSLTTKVPQFLVIHDLAFEHFPEHLPFKFRYYLQKYTPKFVQKARHIFTVSEFSKQDIIQTYQTSPEKIDVIYNSAHDLYHPLDENEKKEIQKKYAAGKPYFYFAGALHPRKNVEGLLKSFQLFKNKTGADLQLLIIGRYAWNSGNIKKAIQNHPFRKEIHQYDYMDVSKLSKIAGAAFAYTFVSHFEGFGIPVLEAIRCHVPGIASFTSSIPEVAGKTALYANPGDPNEIAEKMEELYLNPDLRNELIGHCQQQSIKFSWDASAEKLYEKMAQKILT